MNMPLIPGASAPIAAAAPEQAPQSRQERLSALRDALADISAEVDALIAEEDADALSPAGADPVTSESPAPSWQERLLAVRASGSK